MKELLKGHAGDVQFRQIELIPVGFKKVERLQHTDISLMNEQTYSSPDPLPIKDHKPILLPAGIYQFFIQKTYNPYTKLMEQVED